MIENQYREKINALFGAKKAGKVNVPNDKHRIEELHAKAEGTAKAHARLPLDLRTMSDIDRMHGAYCK